MSAAHALELLLLIVGACAVAALARWRGLAAPILLVLAGLGASYLPGLPEFRLSPDFILLVVLPPLVYAAALESSYLSLRDNLRPLAAATAQQAATAAGIARLDELAARGPAEAPPDIVSRLRRLAEYAQFATWDPVTVELAPCQRGVGAAGRRLT